MSRVIPFGKRITLLMSTRTQQQLVITASLMLILLYGDSAWFVDTPCRILALAMLLYPTWQRIPQLWLGLGFLVLAGACTAWATADNHRYLIGYWLLTVGVAYQHRYPAQCLRKNARVLIGLCFALATLHKLLSPDFMSGEFFHFSLLQDPRLEIFAGLFGFSPENVQFNEVARTALTSPSTPLTQVNLADVPSLRLVARVMSVWTIAIEGLLAVAFLFQRPRFIHDNRDLLLIFFIITTYALAPVIGFGWLLLIMGLAQSTAIHNRRIPLTYLLIILLLQFYATPWQQVLTPLFSPS